MPTVSFLKSKKPIIIPSFLLSLKPLLNRDRVFLLSSVFLYTGLYQVFHSIIEFSALKRAGLPFYFILFHVGFIGIGTIIWMFWLSKYDPLILILVAILISEMAIGALIFVTDPLFIIFLLVTAGISIGMTTPAGISMFSPLLDNPEHSGRITFLGLIGISLFMLVFSFLQLLNLYFIQVLIFIISLPIITVTYLQGRNTLPIKVRKTPLKDYFRSENLSLTLMMFITFSGFFFTNVYYSCVLLLELFLPKKEVISSLCCFNITLYLVSLLIMIPSGYCYDRIGRRDSISIGLFTVPIGFLLTFFIIQYVPVLERGVVMLGFFPFFVAIGICLAYYGTFFLLIIELGPKENQDLIHIHSCVSAICASIGMVSGVLVNELFKWMFQTSPQIFLYPTLMFAIYLSATVLLYKLEEPLPTRAEIEWRDKAEAIIVLTNSGVPLYDQILREKK